MCCRCGRNESIDLLGGYRDFRSHYEAKLENILANEQQYTQNAMALEDAIERLMQIDQPQDACNLVAPGVQEQQLETETLQNETLTHIEQEDVDANAAMFLNQPPALLQRFDLEINRELMSPEKYRELMRGLNTKQKQIVKYH